MSGAPTARSRRASAAASMCSSNNAGVGSPHLPTIEQTVGSFERILSIHLTGMFLFSREDYAPMVPQGGGAIVKNQLDRQVVGAAASQCLWRGQSRDRGDDEVDGLRVGVQRRGFVATDLFKKLEADGFVDTPRLERRIPMGRLAMPDEIAAAIHFLSSPMASNITGRSCQSMGAGPRSATPAMHRGLNVAGDSERGPARVNTSASRSLRPSVGC
jgi:NAD(P)-dependent dehydrogenase (short-subunit alcohol dehydrogenase family)